MRVQVIIAVLLLCAGAVAQTCSGASPTWTASDTSSTAVQACFNEAGFTDGDTINLPTGTSTWTTPVTPNSHSWTLAGNGSSNTHIICNIASGFGNDCIFESGVSGKQLRITGIDWQYESADSFGILMFTGGTGLSFRFDHNTVEPFPTTPGYGRWLSFRVLCISPGCVIDHNTITDEGSIIETLQSGDSTQAPTNGNGAVAWTQSMPFENVTAVYYEFNTIGNPSVATHQVDVIDCDDGGAYVFRDNTTGEGTIGNHGFDSVDNSCRMENIYRNTLTQTSATAFGIQYRGGTGVDWNNTFAGGSTANNPFAITTYRSDSLGFVGSTGHGHCDGTNTFDSNLNVPVSVGYHCRSQLGMGSGANNGWDSQPLYSWNNCKTSLGCVGGANQINPNLYDPAAGTWWGPQEIVQNRDWYQHQSSCGSPQTTGVCSGTLASRAASCTAGVFYFATDQGAQGVGYQCAAGNTWNTFYTPFTSPHPLDTSNATSPTCTPGSTTSSSTVTETCTNPNSGTTVMCASTTTTPVTNGAGTACTTGTLVTTTFNVSSTSTMQIVAGTSLLPDSAPTSYSITITGGSAGVSGVSGAVVLSGGASIK